MSEAGTVRLLELELSPTVPPPDPLRVTVQVVEESGPIVPGLQVIELMVGGMRLRLTVTPPPLPVTAIASPAGEVPRVLIILIGTALPPVNVTDTVATTPSEIALAFKPHTTHVTAPAPPAQDIVLPAGANVGPAVTAKLATLAAG